MSPVELLDYTKADIRIMVETPWERHFRVHSAAKEPETTAWIDEHVQEGDVFWDIGACVGTYGLMAASRGADVTCVEPELTNLARLDQNIALNPGLPIKSFRGAISDKWDDEAWLSVPHGKAGAANNHLGGEGDHCQSTTAITLDQLNEAWEGPPNHVKIDVDGHELQVVRGGVETLQACKTVMIEVDHDTEGVEGEIRAVFDGFTEEVFHRSANIYNHLFVRSTD